MRTFVTFLAAAVLAVIGVVGVVSLAEAHKPGPAAPTPLWAVVNVDGTLARGSGAVSSFASGVDGEYQVTFDRDVSQCAYVAGSGSADDFPADDALTFGVNIATGDPNSVWIIEYDAILGYDSYSYGFHLIVQC